MPMFLGLWFIVYQKVKGVKVVNWEAIAVQMGDAGLLRNP
jgi:hypothetical protein